MNQSFSTILIIWIGIVPTLIPTLVLGIVWFKTGSMHIPMRRIWQLFYGSREVTDMEIKKFMEDQDSVMYFRWMHGIRVESLMNCHELIAWTCHHNIRMKDVAVCGKYFDLINLEVKKLPSHLKSISFYILCLIAFAVAVFSLVGCIFLENTLVQFKSTGRYFWLSAEQASPYLFSPQNPALTKGNC